MPFSCQHTLKILIYVYGDFRLKEELKQLGFFRSRVDKLEMELSSLKQQLRSRPTVAVAETAAFTPSAGFTAAEPGVHTRPQSAPANRIKISKTSSSENFTTSANEYINPESIVPANTSLRSSMQSKARDKTMEGGDTTTGEYAKSQIKRLQEMNRALEAKINSLSQALAAARSLPLLQQRSDDHVDFPEWYEHLKPEKPRKPGENGYYPNFPGEDSEAESLYDDHGNYSIADSEVIVKKKEAILADIAQLKQNREETKQAIIHRSSREEEVINSIRKKKSFAKLPTEDDDRTSWFS